MFAFINSSLGGSSAAAGEKRRRHSSNSDAGPVLKDWQQQQQQHKFQHKDATSKQHSGPAAVNGKGGSQRQALASSQ
ncbi:hypothetical protein MMC29_001872, partial [Sticta canariensis]|nr:hypothetical protein [Sticta canariensis]